MVRPLIRNRWNLNIEATLACRKQRHRQVRIFVSEQKWKDYKPTEEEVIVMLGQGDDSAILVPVFFILVTSMPVILNENTHQGLKLKNSGSRTAHHDPRQGSPGPPDRRRYRAPFWPAVRNTAREKAMAASRRLAQTAVMRVGVCMYGLQGAREKVGSGGAEAARGQDHRHRWPVGAIS
ncbi:PIF1 [Fusarium pseudoanthophilum]|uniref:PIF1 n=1 Tax=Fusarium pseudoanthophilum TaxID=48495 RepID=A0A8H5Q5X0_9HYPO|nr:PIF1 [Fusarium pseudoanthophilum]